MRNFESVKKHLINTTFNQIDLDEIDRDPLSYAFIYWGLQKHNISLQIMRDIESRIKLWKDKFLSNPQMNNFIDRNITTIFFIFSKIDRIGVTPKNIEMLLSILKKNFNSSKNSFFGNLFYTVLILNSLQEIKIDKEISEQIKQAKNKISSYINHDVVFNDAKIFPFILELLDENKRVEFIKNVKYRALVENGQNIVDQDIVFYAWALLKYKNLLSRPELDQFNVFAESTLSSIDSIVQILKEDTLEKLYGKNLREKLPFYWLGYAYEFVFDFEDFVGKMTYNLHEKTINLLRCHKLDNVENFLSNSIEKLKEAKFFEDEAKQRMLSTEGVYNLGRSLEGILKYALYRISKEKIPEYRGEGLDQTIERVRGKLKKKDIDFLNDGDKLDKLIDLLVSDFRNIASHYDVDKDKLEKDKKFEPKQLNLEEFWSCLQLTETAICNIIERLDNFGEKGHSSSK